MTISDHSWTSCDLQLHPPAQRDKCWTLNKTLLQSDLVIAEVAKEIEMYLKENVREGTSEVMIWDALKATIRGSLISKASYPNKLRLQKNPTHLG